MGMKNGSGRWMVEAWVGKGGGAKAQPASLHGPIPNISTVFQFKKIGIQYRKRLNVANCRRGRALSHTRQKDAAPYNNNAFSLSACRAGAPTSLNEHLTVLPSQNVREKIRCCPLSVAKMGRGPLCVLTADGNRVRGKWGLQCKSCN